MNTLTGAVLLALASSPTSNAAPGYERGARARVADTTAEEDERRGGFMLVGGSLGALASVMATIAAAGVYQAHLDATVPPEQRNPDAHVTPILMAFFASPVVALAGAAVGAAAGIGVDALLDANESDTRDTQEDAE